MMQKSDEGLQEHERWWSLLETADQMRVFTDSIGSVDGKSRLAALEHLKRGDYTSLLDCGAGTGVLYDCLLRSGSTIEYTAVDITPRFVADGRKRGLRFYEGSVENLPFGSGSFDVCYARHLFEHLRHYETALREMVRVAKREVMHTFFIPPGTQAERISLRQTSFGVDAPCYYNAYGKSAIEQYVTQLDRVESCSWEEIDDGAGHPETTLHITVDD
jgi:ubiquinone/menaquinone biosynthesis C-methylase UbiE